MEQLTEFVAKSFIDSKPPVIEDSKNCSTSSSASSAAPLNAAHMISNILSTMPQMSQASGGQWSLPYPFPLFTSQADLSSFHSKYAINTMVERFSEMQHQLSRSHSLHYPTSMLYNHKQMFPFLVPADVSALIAKEATEREGAGKADFRAQSDAKANHSGKHIFHWKIKIEPITQMNCRQGSRSSKVRQMIASIETDCKFTLKPKCMNNLVVMFLVEGKHVGDFATCSANLHRTRFVEMQKN